MKIEWEISSSVPFIPGLPFSGAASTYNLIITHDDAKIEGKLHVSNHFFCSSLSIAKNYFVTDEEVEEHNLKDDDAWEEYAKAKAIRVVSKKLKERCPFYEGIISSTVDKCMVWTLTNPSKYDFYIMDGKKKINGRVNLNLSKNTAKISLPWINISRTINTIDEEAIKNETFELIKENLTKKIKIAKEL